MTTTTLSLTWLQKVLCLVGCGVFFAVLYLAHGLVRHSEIEDELDRAVRVVNQDSPGWQLADLEAARAPVAEEENAARDVDRAGALLPSDWSSLEQRRLIYIFSRSPYALDESERQILRTELAAHKEALDEARPLADKPRGRHALPLGQEPWNVSMVYVTRVQLVTYLLTLNVIDRADAGDQEEALRACRGAFNALRSLGDEPTVPAQLMRKNQSVIVVRGVQHLLNHGESTATALADVQNLLQEEADHPGLVIAVRGYRAMLHALLTAVEAGQVTWDQMFPNRSRSSLLDWGTVPTRDELRHQHAEMLPYLKRMIEAAGKPSPERATLLRDLQRELEGGEFPLLAPALHDLPNLEECFAARNGQLRCAVAAVACERYRRDRGAWPESLADLTPDYLKETALDPATGKELRFQRCDDSVVISSQCPDDRGRRYDAADPTCRYGVAFRLWDVSLRRKPKPPQPPEMPPPLIAPRLP